MLAELLGAPPVVDDGERRIRLTPVVDVLSVVRNDVSVTRSIGATESTVVELEAVTTSCRTKEKYHPKDSIFLWCDSRLRVSLHAICFSEFEVEGRGANEAKRCLHFFVNECKSER